MKNRIQKAQAILLFSTIIFTGFLTSPVIAGLEGPVVDAISYYNQAVDAASEGSIDEALILINKSLEIQPDFYLAQVTKASLYSQTGRHSQAEIILNEAEKTHPGNVYVLTAKASLYLETGQYKKAIQVADHALAIDPSLIETWIIKGTAHGGLGQYGEELNASSQALLIDPENEDALSNYEFAQKGLMLNQSNSDPVRAEKSSLSLSVLFAGVLSAVALQVLVRK
ncbi:tetratricopeptide repeat protein [Methanospirillum sp.]